MKRSMPFYHFWSLNENKETISGLIAGKSQSDVFINLKKFNQQPLKIKRSLSLLVDRFTDVDRFEICLALSELLKAGVTLIDALISLSVDQHSLRRCTICYTFAEFVRFGYGVQSFCQTDFFDETGFETLLQAEKTGNISAVFEALAEHYKEMHDQKNEWNNIIRYPIFLVVMMSVLVSILSCFVLPNLEIFIPVESKGAAYMSFKWFSGNLDIIGFFCVILVVIMVSCKSLFYHVPIICRIRMNKFWCNLSFCLNHDISLIESIELSAKTLPSLLQKSIASVRVDLLNGKTLFDSFQKIPAPSQARSSLILIAQKTGNVTEMVQHFAKMEKKYTKNLIKMIISWTQPILILMMGLVVLWILQATIVPLYDSLAEFKD